MVKKLEIYFMSLGFLFILLLIKTAYIPMYWGSDWQFVGFKDLFINNILSLLCVFALFKVYICKRNFDNEILGCKDLPYKVVEVENANENFIVFLTTYIIPLLDWDFNSLRSVVLFVTIFVLNGWLLVKTNLYYQNPMLALLGYNVYFAEINRMDSNRKVVIISKDKIRKDSEIFTHTLDEDKSILLANVSRQI